ncbi:hypothetical protein E2C01_012893 [Portunus trituberculatus]|uniref:Uncharacterized protein n=1 Tax=Portunus trituberculatus TaxID=210409 RepID=A0A5B7DFD9_PORTR|nr:hypothetical protein [Portunus trituberculatus]
MALIREQRHISASTSSHHDRRWYCGVCLVGSEILPTPGTQPNAVLKKDPLSMIGHYAGAITQLNAVTSTV